MSPEEAVRPERGDNEEGPTTEERVPKKMADPRKPRKEEIEAHEITHIPYRNWCEVCVCVCKERGRIYRTGRESKSGVCRRYTSTTCLSARKMHQGKQSRVW